MTIFVHAADAFRWEPLPSIPDRLGYAGSYGGLDRGALLVAGGANFPDRPPWEGGSKVWYDRLLVLPAGDTAWRDAGHLPEAAGYGASLSTAEGVLLIGGGNATENFRRVLRLRWDGHAVQTETLPELPVPLAMSSAAQAGQVVYVAGGLEKPDSLKASSRFLALDLDHLENGWRTLQSCPGPERMLASAGSDGASFYFCGGAKLISDTEGKPQREWLRDAWRYTPGGGWTRLADLPRAAVAAPAPAVWSQGRLLILGGDDGAQVNTAPEKHRGFPRDVLAYDPRADRWTTAGELPFSLVTTTCVRVPGRIVIAGGEKKPGIRSTEVWAAELP